MGRCNGYRPRNECREEVERLRAILGTLRDTEWVKARYLQQAIMSAMGVGKGPSNGAVEPRACRYCRYYGHTRQSCTKRKADEEARLEAMVERASQVGARPQPHDG